MTIDEIMEEIRLRFDDIHFTYDYMLKEDHYMLTMVEDKSKKALLTLTGIKESTDEGLYPFICSTMVFKPDGVELIEGDVQGNISNVLNLLERLINYREVH